MNNQKYNHPKSYTETINGVSFKMIFVEGGDVLLSGAESDKNIFVEDFFIAETPVTQKLWNAMMGFNPSAFKGLSCPIERVSWIDICQSPIEFGGDCFLDRLNKIAENFPKYHLPTEAIWQFAAQGGKFSEGYKYSGSDNLKEVAWFEKNSHDTTYPVKMKQANELGLYDMSGNIGEWCADIFNWDLDFYSKNGHTPNNYGEANKRSIRGGFYGSNEKQDLQIENKWRDGFSADLRMDSCGFRLARYLPF